MLQRTAVRPVPYRIAGSGRRSPSPRAQIPGRQLPGDRARIRVGLGFGLWLGGGFPLLGFFLFCVFLFLGGFFSFFFFFLLGWGGGWGQGVVAGASAEEEHFVF